MGFIGSVDPLFLACFAIVALPALALAIPFWVRWKAANLEKFEDIARGFGDQDFVDYLAKGEYQKVLKGS